MSAKFKTLRHIETVRNFLGSVIKELIDRQSQHDQSKLQSPEAEMFEVFTEKLRGSTYGSEEYKGFLKEMAIPLKHHYENNRHHPEHFENGVDGMNLIDLIELMCDWKASGLRHDNGDIFKSIEINKERFGLSEQLVSILKNTATWINEQNVYHNAKES